MFLAYAILLYIFAVLPPEKIPAAIAAANDKALHFLDYFILALLAYQTLYYSSRSFFYLHAGGKAVVFSLFYGAFMEWVQIGIPGRGASFSDWAADSLGVLVASGNFRIAKLPNRQGT